MHSLNLKRINEKAPYLVTLNENDETYTFVTESGVEYSIGFMQMICCSLMSRMSL
ncbi:hypothetical protein HMPREF0673_00986 [Leyella stercorea DSM 18206]|uniref:Uncharacterized protein n=1 Tax=Leyella stercorea DSM 18206 TaxID=1002367 RepID=G6AWI8_9BACT|nr:hypothetical protein HMPREF0673_00986 [Leyella stercorea DSM 18206]